MKKILIVDDKPYGRDILAEILSLKSYLTLKAHSGPEALAVARREKPDLILLDAMLPSNPNGFEVCRWLKADKATQNAIVIILSKFDRKSDIEQGLAAGADDFFIKTVGLPALMAKVDQAMDYA